MKKRKNNSPLYKVISDEALMAILTLDANGKCVYANNIAHDLLEFPIDYDLTGYAIENLFPDHDVDRRVRALDKSSLDMQGLIQEILIKKHNGETFVAMLGLKKIKLSNKLHILMMIQDVTLQKKLQREITAKQSAIHSAYKELLEQNQQLKELDVAKNRFIGVTTHELRTPLSAMVASAEILKMKLYDTEEQHDEFITMIYDQGQHLLNLVNDILDFSKIQSNKMDYFIEQKELLAVVEHEVHGLQSMAQNSNIELTLLPFSDSSLCYFDEVRIKQVLTNLINNAIKYNNPNGKVIVSLQATESFIHVCVADTGKGIAPEDHAKVFNEFETLGKIAHHAKGTGLGLPISQRMIQAMGGEIQLESELGKGSKFLVTVPTKKILTDDKYKSRPDDSGSGDLAA